MMNDLGQLGDFAARMAWHLCLWVLNGVVSLIQWIAQTVMGWLTTLLQAILHYTGAGAALQPIAAKELPYWTNVGVIVNYMASTFVGNGTLQFCLSLMLETLIFALVLRAFFWIWAHIPIIGKGL